MPARQRLGRAGEELAAEHLASLGYEVVARNFRTRRGEIDLVCRRRGEVSLVEVKTRGGGAFGSPLEAVDERKRSAMVGAAGEWRAATGWRGPVRFQVVGIAVEVVADVLA